MSFEKTHQNIASVPAGGYSAQQLVGMLEDLAGEVLAQSQVEKINQLPLGDRKQLLTSLHSLSRLLLDAHIRSRDGLAEFMDETFREEVRCRGEELRAAEAQLAKLAPQIMAEEEKADRLKRTLGQIKQRRKYLLDVQAECLRLQEQIQQLNNATMDSLLAEKATLEEELAQRKEKTAALEAQVAPLREQNRALESFVSGLTAEVEQLRRSMEELETREQELLARKAEIEQGSTALQARVEAAEESLERIPDDYLRVQALYDKISARLTVMRNAVNSARTDAFLAATLFSPAGPGAQLTVENYPDLSIAAEQPQSWEELENWFYRLEQRILGQLTVLREMLARLVEAAQSSTARS